MKRLSGTIAAIASALLLPAALQAADSEPAAKPKAEEEGTKAAPRKTEAMCEYVTGSRIRHDPPVSCDSGTLGMRTFTGEDLRNTGETNIADALRKLDPRLQ